MSKKIQNQEEVVVAEAVSKTEQFFEQNGKKCIIALVALLLVVAAGYAYKFLVMDKNEVAAAELLVEAQERFSGETPNFDLALNGDEAGAGFLAVADEYGSTNAGNLAKHYAGICYLRLGDLENAAKYLAKYKAVKGLAAEVVNAQNLGLQGDVAVEQGDYEKAAKLFKKAVAASENNYTAPLYLYKQALALVAAGKTAEAKACYKAISEKYSSSVEARDADKALGALE
ncbi:MAG: tetratricopeptide repeat protein [Alistipes sp.]|nr:tetratricopeptide repeat protein [Alistipes sp.]